MSTFSVPSRPASQIACALEMASIGSYNPNDLVAPTPDLFCSILANFITYFDPECENPMEEQMGFAALGLLQNPDDHVNSIPRITLYCKARSALEAIGFNGFTLRDLLFPDPGRAAEVLSIIVNYIFHRQAKLDALEPIVTKFQECEAKRAELEARIAELNTEISDIENARKMEEPIVQEVEAEVRQLRQTIQSYNKQQMSLKASFKELKEKGDAIKEKISQADFELNKVAQENSKLLSKVVQSPEKIQTALEEKKSTCAELKRSEKLAMQSVQEKKTMLEVYSKAHAKMSKHLSWMQTIHEQVESAKAVEKEVKTLKAKLHDEEVLSMSLEAKIAERQGKAKQLEELIKAAEKDRDLKQAQDSQKLEAFKREMAWNLQCLQPRERKAEIMVAKEICRIVFSICPVNNLLLLGENLRKEADSVREAGRVKEEELRAKLEEIIDAFRKYANSINSILHKPEQVMAIEISES